MKKLFLISLFTLFAIAVFSTEANAQTFQVNNNTSSTYQVDYCSMSSGSVPPSGSYSNTSTCTLSLPCALTLSFPGTTCPAIIVPLSPCPTLGTDYITTQTVTTGCAASPRVRVTFRYDGGNNDITITLN